MTHTETIDKTSVETAPRQRLEFLRALYPPVQTNLLLEIRCIHPETGDVRVLWATNRHTGQLLATLRQADALNKVGYGIYFAPCLRQRQKGKADTAALLPGLWIDIDCDNEPDQRTAALDRLHQFNPAPSVIVDSGGGWHAYRLVGRLEGCRPPRPSWLNSSPPRNACSTGT